MLSSNVESEKIFAKPVPVIIKDGVTNQSRSSHLFLSVEWHESSTVLHKRELLITLTDENDPFFLYNLHLSEDDFHILKNNQGLLVDFMAFPQKFIDLIELSVAEESKAHPKFLLNLNINERSGGIASLSQLDVVETNPFKHLIHLSLKFLLATESSVKQYLAICFRNLKEEKRNLQSRLCVLEKDFKEKLTACQETLEKKSQELDIVRKELSVELSMKESKHARELMEERDKFLTKQREEECRLEKDKQEKERNFKKQIQQLEARVSCLDTLNKEIQDKNYKQDVTIRELRSNTLSKEEELRKCKESLCNYKEQHEKFQLDMREKHMHLCHQKEKIEELEQEIHIKKQHFNKLQEELNMHHNQMKKLENELEEAKEQLRKKERKCANLEEDIAKANHVILKLQSEVRSLHIDDDEWQKISSKHQNVLQDKEKTIQKLKKDLADAKIECKKAHSEIQILKENLSALQEKMVKQEKENKAQDQVIKYLNRQITDKIVGKNFAPSHLDTEKILTTHASGDQRVLRVNTSPNIITAETKSSLIRRNSNDLFPRSTKSPKEKLHSTHSGLTVDSAYSTSPSSNTKSTNIITGDLNANQSNLEIDSQALSAAFGNDHILKHSTAKKPMPIKGKGNIKKS